MKELLQKLFGKTIYLLVVALVLFAIAFFLKRFVLGTTSANYYSRLIQQDIQKKEADFQELSLNSIKLQKLVSNEFDESELNSLLDKEKGYMFFIYRADTISPRLLFWNSQSALPPLNLLQESDASRSVRLANGLFIQSSKSVTLADGRKYLLEALIPVQWKYFVEMDNLKKEFAAYPGAGTRVDVSTEPTDLAVKSKYGNTLFYLQKKIEDHHQNSWWFISIILLGFFLIFLYIHQTAHYLSVKMGFWTGVVFLFASVIVLRLLSYRYPNQIGLKQFEIFDPLIYSSSYVLSSLGDLFINTVLFGWMIVFVSRRLPAYTFPQIDKQWVRWALWGISVSVLVISTFVFANIVQSLVADGQISFNVTNFFSLTQYSFIGFVILAVLALSYFFLAQVLLTFIKKFNTGPWYTILIAIATVGLVILSFSKNSSVVELNIYVLVWLIFFIWIMQQKIYSGFNFRLNISEVLFWLFFFSFSLSSVIIFENRKIELMQRMLFAQKLSIQADPSSEQILSISLAYLDNDFLAPNFKRFYNPEVNKHIKDSIINKNFSAYINKYETKIFTYNDELKALYNEEPVSFDTLNTIHQIKGKATSIAGLHYIERSFDKFSYIFKREVVDSLGDIIGHLFVISEPKRYKSDALIPELFKQTRQPVPEYSSAYSYGIYSNLDLISYYNDYPFPTHLSPTQVPKLEFEHRQNDDYEELWYRLSSTEIVVIAKKDNVLLEAITLFAWLFSAFLLLLALYRLTALIIRSKLKPSILRHYWQLSIRSQIHSTIIMLSLLSFVVIGVATIIFFVNRYDRNNQDRLSRAMQIMVNEVQNKMANYKTFDDNILLFESGAGEEVENLMQEISEIHGTDVNLYDTAGNLRVSSNPFIYNKGVLSEKMNPRAYYFLKNKMAVQYLGEETMGEVNYFSIYCPVRDEEGIAYAFLNIPFFTTQLELKQEISNLIVTIINLNAFIFLVAGAISLFITNRITSSFTIIGQKMRDINLQKINQEIQWKRNDEIGELVKEYNKMVHKLDESAVIMAKNEREGAWRQMARQVAHEIKNPLTPMKLSIQYLQKAIDNNSPNVKEMTGSVARTLVEQIDHLSKIASDFSQFANIGNPRNEVFDLHELLFSLSSLYESTENLEFTWNAVPQRVMLYADKTQLNRLFTNLLQNAIEASENRENRVIVVEEELQTEFIVISVADNGGGIPLAMRDKIFTPNFTTKTSGTGLGLAMSKSIAEQALGEIWFETVEGEGTTFYVKLPLLRAMD